MKYHLATILALVLDAEWLVQSSGDDWGDNCTCIILEHGEHLGHLCYCCCCLGALGLYLLKQFVVLGGGHAGCIFFYIHHSILQFLHHIIVVLDPDPVIVTVSERGFAPLLEFVYRLVIL